IYTLILVLALGALLIPQQLVSLGAPNVSGSMFRLVAEPQRQNPPERLVQLSQLDSLPLADAGDSPLGRDPRRWREMLSSKVNQRFQEVFPGVDLVFAGNAKRLEAVLIVKPGVDPASIRFAFPQTEAIGADAQGNIWVAMPGGDLGFMRPILTRQNEKVSGSFAVQQSGVVLQVQDHDAAQPLLVRFDVVFPERPVNLLDQILYRTFKAENYQPTSPASPEQTTTVTATKAVDNATVAPGGTLMYTVTIANTGATTANGVQFTDTISTNTTLVGGSVASSPIGADDTYTATGNIPIAPSAGVLANDVDPDTGNNTGLTVTQVQGVAGNVGNATNTTAAGFGGINGSVTVQSNGCFTYEPPPGFTGSDTFTYRVADAGGKFNDATVTITVSNLVWFVDNTAGGSLNRGTFSHPFTNIANFNTANTGAALRPAAGHHIVLRPSGGTYNEADGINLLNNQTLTGAAVAFNSVFSADANSSAAYTTFAASVGTAPTINTTAGDAVDLAIGNAVRGLNVGNTPGFFGFDGTAVGSLIIGTVNKTGTGGAINVSTSGAFGATVNFGTLESTSSPTNNINLVGVTGTLGVASGGGGLSGPAGNMANVNISGGSVSMTYPGSVTKGNTGAMVNVISGHTGTLTFTGTLSATNGTGLQFDNADGTYNFNGTTTLNGGDAGVDILNGSGGTFTFGTGTTITNPSGNAFVINASNANATYSGSISDSDDFAIDIDNHDAGTVTFQTGTLTSSGASAQGIRVQNSNGGTISFNSPTKTLNTATNVAVTLSSNTGGTMNFGSGGLDIDTTTGAGFSATGGGTVNVTGANNTIDSISATALNVTSTTIGGSDLNFVRISSGNNTAAADPVNGIVLNTTGSSGGLTVAGSGPVDSGGIIQRTTGSGILATDTQDLSLTQIRIDTPGNHGIEASNLRGTCLLANSTIIDFALATGNGFKILNTSNNLTLLTISGSTFNGTATGNAGVSMEAAGTSNMTLSIEAGCVFTDMFGDGVQALTQTGFTGTISATVKDSTFNNAAAVGNGGIFMAPFGGSGTFNFDIDDNTFSDIMRPLTNLGAINVTDGDLDGSGPTVNGQIRNNTLNNIVGSRGIAVIADTFAGPFDLTVNDNTIDRLQSTSKHAINVGIRNNVTNADVKIMNNLIGQAANLWTAGSGTAEAILVLTQDAASANVRINNNVVTANATLEVVRVRAIGTSTQNATINNNTLTDTSAAHIELAAVTASGTPTMCANISGNVLPGGAIGVIQLTESAGALNVTQASAAAVAAANSGATVTVSGTPTFGVPACTLPTFAPIETDEQKAAQQSSGNDAAIILPEVRQILDQIFARPMTAAEYFKVSGKSASTHQVAGGGSRGTVGQMMRPVFAAFATSISYVNPLNLFERAASANEADVKQTEQLSTQDRPQRPQRSEGRAEPRTEAPQRQQPKPPTRILASPESGETVMVGPFNLPPGESVQIMFSVTVTGTTGCSISNQGSVSGGNFSAVTTNAAVTTILQAPSAITCPANITGTTDTGLCTSVETFATPTTSAGCPVPTVTCAPPSGTAFAVG
ncbi:MAG: Ig-like domain-containing protein, partial [Acidobacteriota bacterium]